MASSLRSIFSSGKYAVAKSRSPPAPPLSFRTAMKALESERDPEKMDELLNQCSKSFKGRRSHLSSMAKLARAHRSDLVDRLIDGQSSHDPEGLWIRLMKCDARSTRGLRMFDLACDAKSVRLTEKSLCTFLALHMRKEAPVKIETSSISKLLKTMSERTGVRPTIISLNQVLTAFVDRNDIGSALEWIEEMENNWNVTPTTGTYNILLGAHLKSRNLSGFDAILEAIAENGLEFNVVTRNYQIMRLCESNECVRAKRLLHDMVSIGYSPSLASYIALIDGFGRLRDIESAREVFNLISPPSRDAYCSLFRAEVEAGDFDSAMETCKEMVKRKRKRMWVPPVDAMQGLLDGLAEEGPSTRLPEAMEVVEKMKTRLKGRALESWREIDIAMPLKLKTAKPLFFIFLNHKNRSDCTKLQGNQ
ncbi:pentatricopeptide repeat-containing protein At5g18475-like [Punica granatum]|uniref:Uncharacterized protein n=2 Tax=Punica granatum TaxID=22663 RepID=A0A218XRB0_PUNGR|nr:pentatricopeptide repeat-containing protein At5g18475-like [Punica granatum]OWM87464.1 hypothetical protein CDL15_Pgr022575 [Punica granatum]PKI46607.1 hypothetical protein CRG98_032949 [Punica granatum]